MGDIYAENHQNDPAPEKTRQRRLILTFWSCSSCKRRALLGWKYSQPKCPFCGSEGTFKEEGNSAPPTTMATAKSTSASSVSLDAEAMVSLALRDAERRGVPHYMAAPGEREPAIDISVANLRAVLTAATMREQEACALLAMTFLPIGTQGAGVSRRIAAAIRARSAPSKEGK